ncbi:MAG: prephenate dehydrogenase/arogenate dehydrogenase family protein [Chloroflexota bacterium]|nr:prephenate dehydrogenase/arogenate dehydrogenase family protein [Chloroflexota bacterium]
MHIVVIGLGLIGGSLGLALHEVHEPGWDVVGYARRPELAAQMLSLGVVDRVETNLRQVVQEADVVVVATPVVAVREVLSRISNSVPRGCVVTDTASTKFEVMKWAEELLPPTVNFIGGHPMAGKETYGVQAAEASLFRGHMWCLTPSRRASPASVKQITSILSKVGAIPLVMDAREHDNLVAGISHLPMLLSAALTSVTTSSSSWQAMSRLAASGYRDLTRLAAGSPEVNSDICITNKEAIVSWIDQFIAELEEYRALVMAGDERLQRKLAAANRARQQWLDKT